MPYDLKRVNYSHDAVIDMLITHPELTQNEIAAIFDYTPAWLSTVMSSDAFQNKLAERREQIMDPHVKLTVEEKFRAVVSKAADVIQDKLHLPMPDSDIALRVLEMGGRIIAAKAKHEAPARPTGDKLTQLAERLYALQGRGVIDVQTGEGEQIEQG